MRYRKLTIASLLAAIEAEVWAGQRFPWQFGRHLEYLHTLAHVIDYQLARTQRSGSKDGDQSVIERVLRKLEYE